MAKLRESVRRNGHATQIANRDNEKPYLTGIFEGGTRVPSGDASAVGADLCFGLLVLVGAAVGAGVNGGWGCVLAAGSTAGAERPIASARPIIHVDNDKLSDSLHS